MNDNQQSKLRALNATVLSKPRPLSSFELTGIDNKPFTQANLQGHWTLFFFGFTNCRSICPTTLSELNKMFQFLEIKGKTHYLRW